MPSHVEELFKDVLDFILDMPDPTLKQERIILQGDLPSPIAVPSGCPFHPRCFAAGPACSDTVPEARAVSQQGHICSCLLCGQPQA